MKALIVTWMLSLIMHFAPAEKLAAGPQFPGWEETTEEKITRYEGIANDLYDVVYDPSVNPIFQGPNGRERTAALVLAVAFHESGFSHDVDKGPCYQGKDGRLGRCDGGLAFCMLQIHVNWGTGKTKDGWTGEELFADRKKCFRTGIRALASSLGMCRDNPVPERLSAYAQGNCTRGLKQSRELWSLFEQFLSAEPMPKPQPEPSKEKVADPEPATNEKKKV